MPAISGVSPVDFTVADLAASERWYKDVFGFTDLLSGELPGKFKVAYLQDAGSGVVLGLVQHDKAEAAAFRPERLGLDHFSLAVSDRADLRAWEARLNEKGIANSGITEQSVGAGLNFNDPDGLPLEFYVLGAAQ
jgi:glyoxylase I family protein